VKAFHLILFSAFFLLIATFSQAQRKGKKLKQAGVVQLNDSLVAYSQSDIFAFPNIDKIDFYFDAKKAKQIERFDNSGVNNEEMYVVLKEYVSNFGAENFRKNVPLLWKLAKLSEKFGPAGEAILLYKTILRHHQQGININELLHVYDSIETDKKQNYVPLDYYYELVDLRKEIDTLRPPHAVLLNMGDYINSPVEDYGPTIGNVDSILLFTSKRNRHSEGNKRVYDEDLFFSIRIGGWWEKAEEFKGVNTIYNEGSACLSKAGNLLYFSRCDAPDGLGNCDLYVSELQDDSAWGKSKNLGSAINSSGWESQPSLTRSGDTLFFASNRVGGFGLTDIYFSVKDSQGKWTQSRNAGPIINTRNSEVSPFFHHKFNVLYFSSNGHPLNFGEFDIYKTYIDGTTWGDPKNIGPLVNGAGSEYYFTIDSQSKSLYYARSSEEDLKNLDLHSFPVPMGAQPEAVTSLKGSLISYETGEPMKGIVSIIDLDQGIEVAPKFLRDNGTFNFDLINKRNYLLIIQGDEFFRIEEIFFLDGDMEINRETSPIESKIEFESLEFENGKANILEIMHADLDKLANFMIDHPLLHLRISGHTDSAGNEDSNLKLSQARADAIKSYLMVEFHVEGDRITAIGYGSSNPIVAESTEKDKQLNRRVEFEIYRK
jgi:outer membrane protein OmpA-like peptidoglycan-associated protein